MYRIREQMRLAIRRDPRRLSGQRKPNPALRVAAEQSVEIIIDLKKLKDILPMIVDAARETGTEEEHEVEIRRLQAKFAKRIAQILKLLDHETITNDFGTVHHEEICRCPENFRR
jgi:hypothetical protein